MLFFNSFSANELVSVKLAANSTLPCPIPSSFLDLPSIFRDHVIIFFKPCILADIRIYSKNLFEVWKALLFKCGVSISVKVIPL